MRDSSLDAGTENPPPPRAVLALRRTLLREGLERLLVEAVPGMKVAHAGDGVHALALVAALQPRIVVAEPEIAAEVRVELADICPSSRLILLSSREHVGNEAIPGIACACGHLSDRSADFDLVEAVRFAVNCGFSNVRACGHAPCKLRRSLVPPAMGLTARQQAVFSLFGEGMQPREIARELGISVKTVETYREQIKQRLSSPDSRSLLELALLWRRGDASPSPQAALDSQRSKNSAAGSGGAKK